jgi:hypothetical protein
MRKKIPVFLCALVLLFSSSAGADTISHTISINQSVAAGDFLFNPALGTLNNVDLILQFSLDGVASYNGNNQNPHSWSWLNNSLREEGAFQLSVGPSSRILGIVRPSAEGPISGNGESAFAEVHFSSVATFQNLSSDPFILRSGDNIVSSVGVPYLFAVNFLASDGNFYTVSSSLATVNGSFYATYNYTPVPEPSTMLLLASGLAGLAALGRRKTT